jgi:uncharacterized protein
MTTSLPDTNVWLALCLEDHPQHRIANNWFVGAEAGAVVLCRSTQQSLLRLLTTPALFQQLGRAALSNKAAWKVHDTLRADERVSFRNEPQDLERTWQGLAAWPSVSPKLWMDAYLAAFAIAGGYQLVTTDKAFKQFKGVDPFVLA